MQFRITPIIRTGLGTRCIPVKAGFVVMVLRRLGKVNTLLGQAGWQCLRVRKCASAILHGEDG